MTIYLIVDALLVAGFGVQHSLLATLRVKAQAGRWSGITPIAWRSVESLCNVVYVLAAASLWRHTDVYVWHLTGTAAVLVYAVAVASWYWYWHLHLIEYDCGLAFGATSLVAALARRPSPKLIPWKVGSRRWIRFPVHTAFFGMFFAIPEMTADLFVLAVVLNVYNVIGSVLYDRRLEELSGEPYFAYERVTGLIWPPIYRAPKGAAELSFPKPMHWRQPSRHVPGLIVGLALGGVYYALLGDVSAVPGDMLLTGVAGLIGAAFVGLILSPIVSPDPAVDWDQQQTDLSTTVSTASAVGVMSWAVAIWVTHGLPPSFAAFLPLWFTVQYLAQVVAILPNRRKWGVAGMATESPETQDVRSTVRPT